MVERGSSSRNSTAASRWVLPRRWLAQSSRSASVSPLFLDELEFDFEYKFDFEFTQVAFELKFK